MLTNMKMIALLFNGNENQVRELANTLNKLHQQLETHCKVFKHEVTYTNLLISKGVQGEKKEKKMEEDGKLDTREAAKQTDAFQYLARDSTRTKSVCGGLIKGGVIQYTLTAHTDLSVKNRPISSKRASLTRIYNKRA